PSMGSGWQNGISSWVRLTAMVPATIAVSTMPPLALRSPLSRSWAATAAGKRTLHSATASRAVTALPDTSTMVGRPEGSIWVSPALPGVDLDINSAANEEHLDPPAGAAGAAALFAVAVGAARPQAADVVGQGQLTRGQGRLQVGAAGGEQAGVQVAVGGHPRAVAVRAERRGDRADEADLAAAVL